MERRLTAILAADVVGYSRLMGQDEVSTLAALKTHRKEVIDPKIAEHRGRVVKLMGDGALGFWKALREVHGTTREPRCWVARIRSPRSFKASNSRTEKS